MKRSEKIEIVGVTAVILGLVFVGLELRQNSDLLRITATQTLAAEYSDALEGMVEDRVWRGFQRQLVEVSNLPGVREWWEIRGSWFGDAFQDYINSVIQAGPAVEAQQYVGDAGC